MATDDQPKTQKPVVPFGNTIEIDTPAGTCTQGGEQLVRFHSNDNNEIRTFKIVVHTFNRTGDTIIDTKEYPATRDAMPVTPPTYSNSAVEFPEVADLPVKCALQVVVPPTDPKDDPLVVAQKNPMTVKAECP